MWYLPLTEPLKKRSLHTSALSPKEVPDGPPVGLTEVLSLGEGNTPLYSSLKLSSFGAQALIKDEGANPTGTFKDRQAAWLVSYCKQQKINEVVLASAGNVAVSFSLYAAKANIKLHLFLNADVPEEKVARCIQLGARVTRTKLSYDLTKTCAARYSQQHNLALTPDIKFLLAKASMKRIAFEIARQLSPSGFQSPDWYVQAVSGGVGPIGVMEGFHYLKQNGLIKKVPKLAVVQMKGCAPMVTAFKAKINKPINVPNPQTRIATLTTGFPGEAYATLKSFIDRDGGTMISVSDEAAFGTLERMKQENLLLEPASAAACAGFIKLARKEIIQPGENAVINCSQTLA